MNREYLSYDKTTIYQQIIYRTNIKRILYNNNVIFIIENKDNNNNVIFIIENKEHTAGIYNNSH